MRTGIDLIKATKAYAVENAALSWWHALSTTALLIAALAGTIWNFHVSGQIICSLLSGLLVLRLFVIYHDQQHRAILSRSKMAEFLMSIFGILALSPSSVWRSSHNYHHSHNSKLRSAHIGSFPVMTKRQFLRSSPAQRRVYLFTRHPVTILFGYVFIFLHGMCFYPFVKSPRNSIDCGIAFFLHIGIGAALFYLLGWQGWLLTQLTPHFVASAIGSYLFYAQHNFPTVTFHDKAGWTYEGAALESSSYMKTSRIMAWFTANIGYHHVHHLNAKIPFYRLPEILHEMPELQQPKTTSLKPGDMFRCLRLKVWDVEAQQMIPSPKV